MPIDALPLASMFFAGLLAGEEFVICVGVRQPLAALEQAPHIAMRQGLIRRLRIIVPVLFVFTLLTGIGSTAAGWGGTGHLLRLASLILLLLFITLTLAATVPINKAVGRWDAGNPPPDWRHVIRRWETLDIVRTFLAIAAFGMALLGQ